MILRLIYPSNLFTYRKHQHRIASVISCSTLFVLALSLFTNIAFASTRITGIQSAQSNKIIRAGVGAGALLGAVSDQVDNWERFFLYGIGNRDYVIKSTYNNRLVTVRNDGYLAATAQDVGRRGVFQLLPLGNGLYALKAYNGKYVRAGVGNKSLMKATSPRVSSWEKFRLVDVDTASNGKSRNMTHNGKTFDIDRFSSNLHDKFAGNMKYAFVIRQGSAFRAGASGFKRTATSSPEQDFTIYDRYNPASATKVITAVAVLRLLEQRGLNINTPIRNYLPPSWNIPNNVRTITFRELLSHASGFRGSNQTLANLKLMVEADINIADKSYSYSNSNFSLARVTAAYLSGYRGTNDNAISGIFTNYVNQMLGRVGIKNVGWDPDQYAETRFYPSPPGNSNGTAYGNWSNRPGSAGIHLSTWEITLFLERLENTARLLSADMKRQMDDNNLGWTPNNLARRRNTAWDGDYKLKGGFFPASRNGGSELSSAVAKFNRGIQVTVVVNGVGVGSDARLVEAYDDAWN